jgi:hypothetical protein
MLQHVRINAGCPSTNTCILPPIQGVVTAGKQGIGVSTPKAAAVAAATVGLAGDVHIPKGIIFTIGAKSIILPRCRLPVMTVRAGLTTSAEGAMPKEQVIKADVTAKVSPMVLLQFDF